MHTRVLVCYIFFDFFFPVFFLFPPHRILSLCLCNARVHMFVFCVLTVLYCALCLEKDLRPKVASVYERMEKILDSIDGTGNRVNK